MASASLAFLTLVAGGILLIPAVIFAVQCLTGSLPLRGRVYPKIERNRRPAVAVLVPAHNEESGIRPTLAAIRRQLLDRDRLIVIADNCSDRTAQIARAEGAEVVERFDTERRGKGFALDAGIRYLRQAPAEIVLLVDADCLLGANAIERLVEMVVATGRPAQSCNLMTAPEGAALTHAVAEFAFLVKNYVRPLGLLRLGLPCQVTGTGIAVPWPLLERVNTASSNRVEDMKLGLDFAEAGRATQFCPEARITSQFPLSKEGADSQRRRWEGGHLGMIRAELRSLLHPRTFRNPARLALTLDLLIPPLTLLAMLLAAVFLAALVLAIATGALWPLAVAATNLLLVAVATVAAWSVHGRKALPAAILYKIPLYVVWKLTLYPRAMIGGDGWVRTDRGKAADRHI